MWRAPSARSRGVIAPEGDPGALVASIARDVAQLGSAPALGAGGRRFESGRPDRPARSDASRPLWYNRRVIPRSYPKAPPRRQTRGIVLALIAGLLLLLPAAAHASKFDIHLSNDIANRTGPGYPKVALGVRGTAKDTNWKCWDDGDLWTPQDHAVSPGGQTRLFTDVQDCFFGYRDVQLSIQESAGAPWVTMDGQDNFRLYFGKETDVGRSGVERCEPKAVGGNCFFISGMPNTWATRPLGTGLMCMVVTKFAQSTAASIDANREDTAYISVRDDGACNIPRGARSWPRNSGTPVQAGYPVMGPTERVPTTITRSPNQAAPAAPSDPAPPAEVLGSAVRSILSGARIACGWGVRGDPVRYLQRSKRRFGGVQPLGSHHPGRAAAR